MADTANKKRFHPSMRSILFISLAAFGFAVMFMVWIVLYQLLNNFYYNATVAHLEECAEQIEEKIETDELEKTAYMISINSKVCIRIFDVGSSFTEILSADILADCFVHNIPNEEWEDYYYEAKMNAGIKISEHSLRDMLAGDSKPSGSGRSLNLVYSKVMKTKTGNTYFVMLDSVFNPPRTLGNVISNQFIFISLLVLILTVITAIVLSKLLLKPIRQMTNTAKQLAVANYDIEFDGRGFSEAYELSETLNYASNELSKNDTLQKELIANVSHDLRTPLTLIRGYAEVMHDIPGENTPENVQIIIDETNHLSELVNDMLDLSRIRSGEIAPSFAVFNITDTISETIERYKKFTDKNGFKINFFHSGDAYVNADRQMILQVVYNFINNAINYSVNVKEITVIQETDGQCVTVSVNDRGKGISEEKLPYIWDRYYKIDKNHKIPSVGSGLGLSIAKQVLKSHSATFGVRSRVGMGSSFWFSLPLVQARYDSTPSDKNM